MQKIHRNPKLKLQNYRQCRRSLYKENNHYSIQLVLKLGIVTEQIHKVENFAYTHKL